MPQYTEEEQGIVDEAKKSGTWMKAPNGEDTNLTEKQWLQVRTPSFKKWFGDWENDPQNASKVIDENGEPLPVYSIASGLDYPGVGPEHAYLRDAGRVNYVTASDDEAMEAFFLLSKYEGIIPAIESSHALAYAIKYAKEHKSGSILVCLSGRGDKDMDYIIERYGIR